MLIQNLMKSCGQLTVKSQQTSSVLLNLTQVRYRKAVSFRKYRQPDYRQKLLLATCEPIQAIDRRPTAEKCFQLTPPPPKADHPYDVLLAKDMQLEMEQSSLVCFYHQNQMSTKDKRLIKNELEHEGLLLRYYNRDIARICWQNTRFESLLSLAVGYDFTVLFAPDTTKIQKIIRISKKYPEVLLLGALSDKRRLITVKQLEALAKMPDLDIQRAIFSHSLNLVQQNLVQTLGYHSSDLSRMLDTHSKEESQEDN